MLTRQTALDYSKEKNDIEEHQTQKLANILDSSVVTFANEQKNKAAQIKTIIKNKQNKTSILWTPGSQVYLRKKNFLVNKNK